MARIRIDPDLARAIVRNQNFKGFDGYARKNYGVSGKKLLARLVAGEAGGKGVGRAGVSSAGARGPAQFIPSTREAYMKQYGLDPWRSNDEAIKAAIIHIKGTGLKGYNPGMPTYTDYILGQRTTGVSRAGGSSRGRANSTTTTTKSIPGIDNSQLRQQLALQYIEDRDNPDAALNFGLALKEAQDVPGTVRTTRTHGVRTGGGQRIRKDGWKGSKSAGSSLANLAKNHGLVVTSTKRATQNTASGGVSDHFSGNRDSFAWDLGGAVGDMDAAARKIAAKLGVKNWKGGVLNVNKTIDGRQYRFQVLYRTNVGGNHYDHIHVGVDRLDTPG